MSTPTSDDSPDDRRLHQIRLSQVLRYDIGANLAAIALLSSVWLAITRRPEILLLAALVAAHLCTDLWLYRRVHSWDGVRIVTAFTLGMWVVTVLSTLVVPAVVAVMTITTLFPAILAVPYVNRRSLRTLVAGLTMVTTMLAIASRRMWVSTIGDAVPGWLRDGIVIAFVPVMTGAVILLLWQTYAWLTESLTAAENANAALKRSRRQVEDHAAELRDSRARVVAAAGTERRRMERDLHDGAQQSLIAAALSARRAQELCDVDPPAAAALLDRLVAQLDRASTELRDLANGLYPAALTDLGVAAALTAAAAESPLPIQVDAVGIGRHAASIEETVYFCCMEAIQNAVKHGGPQTQVLIRLFETDDNLVCVISDDGVGFVLGSDDRRSSGRGLTNMADRAAAAGGLLAIDSAPQRGTQICVTIPLMTR